MQFKEFVIIMKISKKNCTMRVIKAILAYKLEDNKREIIKKFLDFVINQLYLDIIIASKKSKQQLINNDPYSYKNRGLATPLVSPRYSYYIQVNSFLCEQD